MSDKKISDLPVASIINAGDVSVLVSNGTDYQFAFASLLQLIGSNIVVGANIGFGTVLPQNNNGNNGDVFINTTTGSFAQKLAGIWTIVYTIPSSGAATDGTVLYGLGIPGNSTGNNNDTYINTGTGIFYKKSAGTWIQAFSMQTGPAGAPGTTGANGTNGTNGFSILNGTGTPTNTSTGNNGDFYINTTTYTLFGPKTAGNWGSGVSLAGSGFATGGSTGQLLAKIDGTDFNTGWVDPLTINDGVAFTTKVFSSQYTTDLLNDKQNTLGFTPENTANKNAANGYAGLDGSGKVAAAQLPSYVDDVLEFANFAALPGTGETGKIYVTLDTNYEYRWSGSTYIQLVASPGITDALAEGSINLYFTVARVLATVLTGLSLGTVSAATDTDTILTAIGKLQAQINAFAPASAAEVDTGTDNTKYVTPLRLNNSKYQDQNNSKNWIYSTSGTGAYTANVLIHPITAYTAGFHLWIQFNNANTVTSITLNLNGLGTKNVVKPTGAAWAVGDIADNQVLLLFYDGVEFVVMGGLPAGSGGSGGGSSKISYNFYQTTL